MPKAKLDDISLYYEVHGKGAPLLLIAGLGSDSASWMGIVRKLSARFRVVTFDNRGAGRTSVPDEKYSVRQMVEDTVKLLDRLEIGRAHIIGHSMGGYIAQELAVRYPERVDKLIFEATAPVSSERNNALFNGFLDLMERSGDIETLVRQWTPWLFSPRAFERKTFITTFLKNVVKYPYAQSVSGFRRQIGAVASFDSRSRIKAIKTRTLVITGGDDILITPRESRVLSENIRGSVLAEIKDTGHCIHIENPAAFTATVLSFLRS